MSNIESNDLFERAIKLIPELLRDEARRLGGELLRNARSNVTSQGLVKTGNLRNSLRAEYRNNWVRIVVPQQAAYGRLYNKATTTKLAEATPTVVPAHNRRGVRVRGYTRRPRVWAFRGRPFINSDNSSTIITSSGERLLLTARKFLD